MSVNRTFGLTANRRSGLLRGRGSPAELEAACLAVHVVVDGLPGDDLVFYQKHFIGAWPSLPSPWEAMFEIFKLISIMHIHPRGGLVALGQVANYRYSWGGASLIFERVRFSRCCASCAATALTISISCAVKPACFRTA